MNKSTYLYLLASVISVAGFVFLLRDQYVLMVAGMVGSSASLFFALKAEAVE